MSKYLFPSIFSRNLQTTATEVPVKNSKKYAKIFNQWPHLF